MFQGVSAAVTDHCNFQFGGKVFVLKTGGMDLESRFRKHLGAAIKNCALVGFLYKFGRP